MSTAFGAGRWAQNGAQVSSSSNSKVYPAVTAVGNGSGNSFVTWEDYATGSAKGSIFVQKMDINGTFLFSSDKNVTVNTTSDKRYPTIVKDGAGGAFVVWEDDRSGIGNTDIYIQRIDGNGNPVWSQDKAVCSATGTQFVPQIAITTDNYIVVVWQDNRGADLQIYAQKIDFDGNAQWANNGVVVASNNADQLSPSVVSDGIGGIVIVWEDYRVDGYTADVFGQRVNSTGTLTWGSAGRAITNQSATDEWFPSIASDGTNFMIAWEDYRDDPDAFIANIYLKVIGPDGTSLISDKAVSLDPEDQYFPRIAYSTDESSYVVVWEDYRSGSAIYAQKINPDTGTTIWASEANVSGVSGAQYAPAIASSDLKGVIGVWESTGNGLSYDIYALQIPQPGSVTINEDDPIVPSPDVTLTIWANNFGSAITQMCISNTQSCSNWEAYATSKAWSLTPGEGDKTVYVRFRNATGDASPLYYDQANYTDTFDGTISINGGSSYTKSASVILSVAATDADEMCISDTSSCSAWEDFSPSKAWTLPGGDGSKTIYLRVRDMDGIASNLYSSSITLDTVNPSTTASPSGDNYNSSQSVTLTCNAGAGSACNKIYYTTDGSIPTVSSNQYSTAIVITGTTTLKYFATDLAGNAETVQTQTYNISTTTPSTTATPAGATYNAAQSITLTSSVPAATIYYTTDGTTPDTSSSQYSGAISINSNTILKFFAKDGPNQEEVRTETYTIDTVAPTGSISINGGASYARNTSVTLTLTCVDAVSGCAEMMLSSDGVFDTEIAEAYVAGKGWTLAGGDGSKTIYVKYKDTAGNWSNSYSSNITLDINAPSTSPSVAGGNYSAVQNVTLTANETSIIYYTLDGTTPTNSSSSYAVPISIGAGTTTLKYFAIDLAGNVESVKSQVYTVTIVQTDTTPPSGSIIINDGAIYTNELVVTLTLSTSDATIISFSFDGVTWSVPKPFSETYSLRLNPGDGDKEVYVKFQDASGNSFVISESITLDRTGPVPPAGSAATIQLAGAVAGVVQSYAYSNIEASWTSLSDATPDLQEYLFSVGDTDGGTNILDWTSTDTLATAKTGSLQTAFANYGDYFGKTFYFNVKAVDDIGNETIFPSSKFIYTPADISSKSGQGDSRVDGFDLGKLGIQFGTTGSNIGADLNRDGTVNGDDLLILGVNFGKGN